MAKHKTKQCLMLTTATEIYLGCWQFDTGHFEWRWDSNGRTLNLSIRRKNQEQYADFTPQLFAKDLNNAVMFAHGFDGGWEARGRVDVTEEG